MKGYIWIAAAAAVLVAMVIISTDGICKVFPGFFACTPTNGPESGETITPPPPTKPPIIQISIASSITKKEWLDQAVVAFNAASKKEANLQVDSRPIQVVILLENDPLTGKPRHWNSPTQVAATLKEEIKPTILSPAATTWILKLNKEWRVQNGKEISSGPWQPLLSTPVVIAMWESRAEALGCWPVPEPDCTWERIRDLAVSPEGWGMFGHPEWGRFHFGYAYVGESDVGTQTAV